MRRDHLDFSHRFAGLELVRIMSWDDYTPCENGGNPRVFFRRLDNGDPRPMGRRCLDCPDRTSANWWRTLPVNQWVQVVHHGSDEMPGPKGVLP